MQVNKPGHDKLIGAVDYLCCAVIVAIVGHTAGVDRVDAVISNFQYAGIKECVLRIQGENGGIGDDNTATHGFPASQPECYV